MYREAYGHLCRQVVKCSGRSGVEWWEGSTPGTGNKVALPADTQKIMTKPLKIGLLVINTVCQPF